MRGPALIEEIPYKNFDDQHHFGKNPFSLENAVSKSCCYSNFCGEFVTRELGTKKIDGDASPSYTGKFSTKMCNDMQLIQKLQLVNTGIL